MRILFIPLLFLAMGCSAPEDITGKARDLGIFLCESSFTNTLSELVSNQNIPLLVEIDTNIISELYKYSEEFWQDYAVVAYEEESRPSNSAPSHTILLKSKDRDILSIHLRYDPSLKKFYILNFFSFLDY
jgi:hypothetical protein